MEKISGRAGCWVLKLICFFLLSACVHTGISVSPRETGESMDASEARETQEVQKVQEIKEPQEEEVRFLTPLKSLKVKIPPLILLLEDQQSAEIDLTVAAFKERLTQSFPKAEYMNYRLKESSAKVKASQFVSPKTKSPPALIISLGPTARETAQTLFPDTPLVGTMIEQENFPSHRENIAAIIDRIPYDVQLAWLKRIVPSARRIGILYDPALNGNLISEAETSAKRQQVEIVPYKITSPNDLQTGLKYIRSNADVLLALSDKTVYSSITLKEILLFCYRNRLPFVGLSASWVKAGALYAIEIDYGDLGRQAAGLANEILAAGSPGPQSIYYPEGVTLALNIRTKDYLNLEIADDIIKGASIAIE